MNCVEHKSKPMQSFMVMSVYSFFRPFKNNEQRDFSCTQKAKNRVRDLSNVSYFQFNFNLFKIRLNSLEYKFVLNRIE